MSELTKLPIPAPSVVFVFEMVGPVVVLQQTPLAVMVPPPSIVIFPPEVADEDVIAVIAVVVIVERLAVVVNENSFPYAVPALFVAYALIK